MLVVGDLDDIFLPKPADLLVSLSEARTCLENLLSRLADMFKDNHNVGNAMSSALQSAYKMIVRSFTITTLFCDQLTRVCSLEKEERS